MDDFAIVETKLRERMVSMREEQLPPVKKGSARGRKTLMVFGILFIIAGVFLGSFACSFQVMIQAAQSEETDENTLQSENAKLKEDVQLLQDQITILQAELDRYKPTSKPSSSSSSSSRSTSTSGSSR